MSHHQIAQDFGYKIFKAEEIDGLTLEQWNTLVAFWNYKAEGKLRKSNPRTVSITTIEGKEGVDYGED